MCFVLASQALLNSIAHKFLQDTLVSVFFGGAVECGVRGTFEVARLTLPVLCEVVEVHARMRSKRGNKRNEK